VVNVCATFAGMPLASGDGLRKALSKKRPVKHLAAYAEEFFAGAHALGRSMETATKVWEMVMSFAGYSFCKGHSCSYIRVAQHSCYLRAHYPAEFMAGVLANGGGFYAPFAYVAEAMRMGLRVLPPDVNESGYRTSGRGREVRVGLQFIKGLSAEAIALIEEARLNGRTGEREKGTAITPFPRSTVQPFNSLSDFRARTGLKPDDLRLLVKVGAFDSIAGGMTRPMMLWEIDRENGRTGERGDGGTGSVTVLPFSRSSVLPSAIPDLKEYDVDRRRRAEYELLGFTTDGHPMDLFAEQLARLRVVRSIDLTRHVGRSVVCAGMLTTSKPVHTVKDEPMEFATFDDGQGLIEAVLFPDIYRSRGHVLFDQGPFVFRGKVEEEFGAITVTVTGLDRLERVVADGATRRQGDEGTRRQGDEATRRRDDKATRRQ
jgi:DNA polymerase III alpha subunit